jgi:hypothetical protein
MRSILRLMRKAAIEDDVDKLYQLPLEEFTAARNLLAKQAGGAGADIRALQKPPLPAWAVNQVFWRRRPVYEALVNAASALRAAHTSVLSGKRVDLRTVGKEHEEALEAALKAALAELAEAGHPATDATRHAIATTLRGLPAEEPPGRLARTLQPGGFEMLSGIPVRSTTGSKPTPPQPKPSTPARGEKRSDAEIKALARAREALASATRALKTAEHNASREEFEAARAARDVDKAARDIKAAREQVKEAQQALDEAERGAATAEQKRASAQRRAQEAAAALSKAQDLMREAERNIETLSKPNTR